MAMRINLQDLADRGISVGVSNEPAQHARGTAIPACAFGFVSDNVSEHFVRRAHNLQMCAVRTSQEIVSEGIRMKNLLVALLIGMALASPAFSQDKAQTSGYAAMNGYFGNTEVFWTPTREVQALIYYNPDFTYQEWRHGKWVQGTFVLNNDQDSSVLCKTRMENSLPITNCHRFESGKVVGDKWARSPDPFEKPKPNDTGGWRTLEKGHISPPTVSTSASGPPPPHQ
jgi:hypothetical protein